MKIKRGKIFNLIDTNGRRNDIISALSGYLSILDNLKHKIGTEWTNMPSSPIQYEFYKEAISLSPDVFSIHTPFDNLEKAIENADKFKNALLNYDIDWIRAHQSEYSDLISKFDNGIEDRARHHTSTLVKLGFTDDKRVISPAGRALLIPDRLERDFLENILPIDNVNIIYLRQLLKLRVYDTDGTSFYSPFNLALYILLQKKRFPEKAFFELIQGFNPYRRLNSIDDYIDNYSVGNVVNDISSSVPSDITSEPISEHIFKKHFRNGKSGNTVNIYFEYYKLLYNFNQTRKQDNLITLLDFYELNRDRINKAFGCGRSVFFNQTRTKTSGSGLYCCKQRNFF